jgi:hypothetical protein
VPVDFEITFVKDEAENVTRLIARQEGEEYGASRIN